MKIFDNSYMDADEDEPEDPDDSTEQAVQYHPDTSISPTDCDDSEPTVYPASEEQADEIDNIRNISLMKM